MRPKVEPVTLDAPTRLVSARVAPQLRLTCDAAITRLPPVTAIRGLAVANRFPFDTKLEPLTVTLELVALSTCATLTTHIQFNTAHAQARPHTHTHTHLPVLKPKVESMMESEVTLLARMPPAVLPWLL